MRLLILLLSFIFAQTAFAGAVITYHGRLLAPDGSPVENSNVSFNIRVLSPKTTGSCVLYEEQRTLNMAGSGGVFVIPIGDGDGVRTTNDPAFQVEKVFTNSPGTVFNKPVAWAPTKYFCNSGNSYSPSSLDGRELVVSFKDGGAAWQTLPNMDVTFVPFAVSSYDSQNIGGAPAESVLRLSSGSAPALSPANFTELMAILNGSSIQYEKVGRLNGSNLPSMINGQVLGWSAGGWTAITPTTPSFTELDPSVASFAKNPLPSCGSNSFLRNDGTGALECVGISGSGFGTVTSITAGAGLTGGTITSSGTLAVNVGTGANQIVQLDGSGALPAVSGAALTNVTAATLSNTASINTSGNIATSGTLSANSLTTTGNIVSTAGSIQAANDMTARRVFLYDNVVAPNTKSIGLRAPADMAALGGDSYVLTLPESKGAAGQVLVAKDGNGTLEWGTASAGTVTSIAKAATAGNPLVVAGTASNPTIDIPVASGSISGYLSATDWTLFNSKQPAGNYVTSLTGDVVAAGPGAAAATVSGLRGRAVSATAPTSDQFLAWDSINNTWKAEHVRMQDIRNAWGGTQMIPSTTCSSDEAMVWSSIADRFTCQSIGSLAASAITSGVFSTARLGSGTADGTTYLSGDGTWKTLSTADNTKLPLAGGTMTGSINMGGQRITNVANVPFVATNPSASNTGQSLRWNNTSGQWEWFEAGESGAGVLSLNGSSSANQTLTPANSATTYGFSTSGGTHTLSIPSASGAGVLAGTISKDQYDIFAAKLDSTSSLNASNLGSGTVPSARLPSLAGDVTGAVGTTTVARIQGRSVSSTAPTANQVLKWSGTEWAPATDSSGTGTVTSVATGTGLQGGPISTTGTISLANTAVAAGNYGSATAVATFTVDAQGRLTTAGNTTVTPAWSSVTGKPTTLAGYGITDAASSTSLNNYVLKAGDTLTGALKINAQNQLQLADADSSHYVALRSPSAVTTNVILTLPATAGTSGQVLQTDGAGVLSWASASSGSVTSVAAGTGLTGGPITSTGTLAVDVGTTANKIVQLNASAQLPAVSGVNLTALNASNLGSGTVPYARLPVGTAANTVAAGNDSRFTDSRAPSGAAGGDLTGSYPSPTIAANAITSAKVANSTITAEDLNFSGVNSATASFVMRSSATGSFYSFGCSTSGHVPTWTVSGFQCQAITETDPKVGANTTHMLSKWNGSALVASGVYEAASTNVGIGTTTPGQKLTVAGIIESTTGGIKFPDASVQAKAVNLADHLCPVGKYLRGFDSAGAKVCEDVQVSAEQVRFSQVSVGLYQSCGITTTQKVQCWGYNAEGQLGDGTVTQRTQPVYVKKIDGTAFASTKIVMGGHYTTCGIQESDGAVYCWGRNDYGQLGNGSTTRSMLAFPVQGVSAAQDLAVSYMSACALTTSGEVWCWGYNGYGQLGNGTTTNSSVPVQVKVNASTTLSNVSKISAASSGSFCAYNTTENSPQAFCWGYNGYGQVGDGTTGNRSFATAVSNTLFTTEGVTQIVGIYSGGNSETSMGTNCAVAKRSVGDYRVYCWGYNSYGQIGDGTTTTRNTPTRNASIGTFSAPVSIMLSTYNICYLNPSSEVLCSGYNAYGELGNGTATTTATGVYVKVKGIGGVGDLSAHSLAKSSTSYGNPSHYCAVTTTNLAVCWGYNGYGGLGNATTANSNVPVGILQP